MRRPVTDSAACDMTVFDSDDGMIFILASEIMYHDFTISAELAGQTFGQAAGKFQVAFLHAGTSLSERISKLLR